MGAVLKWLIGLILFLVLLVAAAVVVLPMVVDPNDYKPQMVSAVEQKLGREFAIEQDLKLSVFPWLGIETGGVRLGNAAGFAAESFAEIEELGVKVKLMPLLSQQVEVDKLIVRGLRLNLEKDANGRSNWEDLAGGGSEQPAERQPAAGDAGPGFALSINGVEIERARVSWDDRQAGQRYLVDGVRLVTGAIAPGKTVPVEAGMLFTSETPAMTLDASLQATVGSDAALTVFRVGDLVLQLDAKGEGLPSGGAELKLSANAVVDMSAATLAVDALRIEGPAMAAVGELKATGLRTNPAFNGRLSIEETNPKTLASMFAAALETTDPDALTRASGELAFAYADGAVRIDPLTLRLDDSSLIGFVHLLDTTGPTVRTRLELDQIDLDRYMPPTSTEPAPAASSTGTAQSKPDPAADPFAPLRKLDFEGDFKIGKLKVGNARMTDVATKVVSKKGVLKLEPMAANLYQGSITGAAELNAATRTPKLRVRQDLKGIQIGPLLADVAGQDKLQGRGELKMDIGMSGLTESAIRRTLNGTSSFAFRDGSVKGVNIAQIIRDASAAFGLGSDKLDVGTPGQTDFSEMSGSVKITNGVIRNSDLDAKSPLIRVQGSGEVDLPKDTIDYLVTTELVGSLAGQGGKGAGELAGVPIPVRISGPLTQPKFRPDLEKALSAKAKKQLEEKQQELQEKIEEKAKGKLDGVLKGLFN
jgi:AsmA protein